MSAHRDLDGLLQSFLSEGPLELPDPSYDEVRDRMEHTRQRAFIGSWRTSHMDRYLKIGLAAAAGVVVAIIGLRTLTGGPPAGSSPSAEPSATASVTAPSSAVKDLLHNFLAVRVAGAGARQYLDTPEEDVPLLYATSSGARYERGEFAPVSGIEWPYGFTAFTVRLFAGDTVVEQLIFAGPDSHLLSYERDGFGTDTAPTTENGQPVAMAYSYFDGEVTLEAAHPWIMSDYSRVGGMVFGRLIPEGPGVLPTTDGGERNDWDELFAIADPALLGSDCQARPDPADAAALAESIRSDSDLGATAPVAVSVGGTDALMMDVKIPAAATICTPADAQGDPLPNAVLQPLFGSEPGATFTFVGGGAMKGPASGEWMRLYLFDVRGGSSMRILAIAIVAPESRFERAVDAALPVVDSIEFHAP